MTFPFSTVIRVEQVLSLASFAYLTGYLVTRVPVVWCFWQARPRLLAEWAFWLVVAFIVRAWLPPDFIHANLHGYDLLEDVLRFPAPGGYRPTQGQGVPAVAGLLCWLTGGGWRTFTLINSLANVGTVATTAILARRLGGDWAARFVLAMGATFPLLVRVAASEDGHNLACLFASIGLVLADSARTETTPRLGRLVAVGSSLILAVESRQSLLPWCVVILAVVAQRPVGVWLRRPAVWSAMALSTLALVPKVSFLLADGSDVRQALLLVQSVVLVISPVTWTHHSLFLPETALFLWGGAVLGAWRAWRARDRLGLTLAIAIQFWFLGTIAMSWHPSAGVEAFRLPLLVLLLPLSGSGMAGLLESAGRRWALNARRVGLLGLSVMVIVTASPIGLLVAMAKTREPQTQEYEVISTHASSLPHDATILVSPMPSDGAMHYVPPYSAFGRDYKHVETWPGHPGLSSGPRYFYQGLDCFLHPLTTLLGTDVQRLIARIKALDLTQLLDLHRLIWDDPAGAIALWGGNIPKGMRPECAAIIAEVRGAVFEPWGEVHVSRHELPHWFAAQMVIPIGVWRLPEAEVER